MVVWRTLDDNEWMGLAKRVALSTPPPRSKHPTVAGAFSRFEHRRDHILEAAGYTDIQLDRYDAKVMVGRTIDDAIDFQLALGPCGEIVREAGELGESKRAAVVDELRTLIAPFLTPSGVMMASSSWAVSARTPM